MGGLITGIIGVVMMPWKLVADPSGYIFTWLVGYSALLGPIGGIMIADYLRLSPERSSMSTRFIAKTANIVITGGFSLVAHRRARRRRAAESSRISRHGEDCLSQRACRISSSQLYDYAWFVGFAIAFVVYLVLRTLTSTRRRCFARA